MAQTQQKSEVDDSAAGVEGVGREREIYARRFSPEQIASRKHAWEILCRQFFQQYVPTEATVVDIGAGDGFFITNIVAKRRIAVDLSEHTLDLRKEGIEVWVVPATEFAVQLDEPVDVVFMSNFIEHLPSKQVFIQVLEECHRVLKPGGMLLILQPNIRYVGSAYWDYIDHQIALTEHSLVEALEITGFSVERLIPRFLPYTVKSRLGRFAKLMSLYLKLPLIWRIFGQQTFIAAKKQ